MPCGIGRVPFCGELIRHGDGDAFLRGALFGFGVASVGVAENAEEGVVGEDSFEAGVGFFGAVGDYYLSGVLGEADAYAAAVVETYPTGSADGVDGEVEEGPVADGIGAVEHAFGFAIGGGDGAAVEVIATDDDGGFDFAGADEIVEGEASAVAFSQPEPTDAAGEALEGNFFLSHVNPAAEGFIFGEEFEDGFVGLADVFGITGEGGPAEGAAASAELGANVGGDEAGEGEGVGIAIIEGALAEVVAVVEGFCAAGLELNHEFYMMGHGVGGAADIICWIGFAESIGFFAGEAGGVIAVEGVVGGGLVGEGVGGEVFFEEGFEEIDGVAEPADGSGFVVCFGFEGTGDGGVEVGFEDIEVAIVDALFEAFDTDISHETDAFVHGDGEGLSAAHAATAGGDVEGSFEGATEVLAGALGVGFVGSLEDALGADVDPGAGGHLAEHDETLGGEFIEMLLSGPVRDEVGVGDDDAGGFEGGLDDTDGFAGLDEEGFVGFEVFETVDDSVVAFPGTGGLTPSAVDDEFIGFFGDFWVEVVHEHAHGGFGLPGFAGFGGAAGSADSSGGRGDHGHDI